MVRERSVSTDIRIVHGIGPDKNAEVFVREFSEERSLMMMLDLDLTNLRFYRIFLHASSIFYRFSLDFDAKPLILELQSYFRSSISRKENLTGIVVDYDKSNRTMRIFNFGHANLYFRRHERYFKWISARTNPTFGERFHTEIRYEEIRMIPGDHFVAFPDSQTCTDAKTLAASLKGIYFQHHLSNVNVESESALENGSQSSGISSISIIYGD